MKEPKSKSKAKPDDNHDIEAEVHMLRAKSAEDTGAIKELRAQLIKLKEIVMMAKDRVKEVEASHGKMNLVVGSMRPLQASKVKAIIASDRLAKFQVTSEYSLGSVRMAQGRIVEARHYPRLLDLISSGLKVIQYSDES